MREQNIISLEAMENGTNNSEFMEFYNFIMNSEDEDWDEDWDLGDDFLEEIKAVQVKRVSVLERVKGFGRTVRSIHHWSVWLARWGGRKFSLKAYLESYFRLSKERFLGATMCKWFGHKWSNHPDEPGFSTCSRCRVSDMD